MNPLQRLAKLALIYIARTKLEGSEVPTYVEVHNWLSGIAEQPVTAPPSDAIVPQHEETMQ